MLSCFLTMGHTFASIQVAKEAISCCKSSIEIKDCRKNETAIQHTCDNSATCIQLIPSIVCLAAKSTAINLQYFHLNTKNQPDTWVQLHLTSHFLAVWSPPKICLNL